jgi:hypothetical protein
VSSPQARIAAVNTILTCLGMWALQLPGVGLLSLFVFVCGFIPIAGVIISTVPIGFVALTEYGFTKVRPAWGPAGQGGCLDLCPRNTSVHARCGCCAACLQLGSHRAMLR